MADVNPPPAPKRRTFRKILGIVSKILLGILLIGMAGWMFLAVRFSDLHNTPPRTILGAIIAIVPLGVIAFHRKRAHGLILFAFSFCAVLGWYLTLQPSHNRDWMEDVAVLPYATINGDKVELHNIRDFDYQSETNFTPLYYDRTVDLSKLRTLDLILSYWSGKAIAHAMVSFGFEDDEYLAVSIETRKEKSEEYSAIEGFFRQYELIYVVADERDVIRLRTNYRREEVYLYRLRAPPEKVRAVFLDYIKTINDIHDKPRFYNALTENCATSVFSHARCAPPYPPFTLGILLSGYSAKYGYEKGGFDHSVSFEELEKRSHINDLAQPADKARDFSQRIRARLTPPQAPKESP